MKNFIRLLLTGLSFAAVLFSCSQKEIMHEEGGKVVITDLDIKPAEASIKIGETLQLKAVVTPSHADVSTLVWKSLGTRVATVDEKSGLVKGVGEGSIRIRVTAPGRDGVSATMNLTVTAESEPSPDPDPGPNPDPDPDPDPDPNPDPDPDPNPDPDPEPGTGTYTNRWEDTGASLPDYPTYDISSVKSHNDFPRVEITVSGSIQHGVYKEGTISFKDPKKMYSDITNFSGAAMKIKGRGNTTWGAEGGIKNPYRVKLAAHPANKILGLNRDKDWILLSDVQDPSLLRNATALRISRMVSMPWTPKFRAVELYINNSYQGCYLLVEAKETDTNKVPVNVSETGEVDSGYYLEIDDKSDEDLYFYSESFGKKIKYKDPENPTAAQKNYIEGYVNDVEKLLKDKNFDSETGYWSKMEVGTFIDQYIVQELTMNVDGNMRLSTYFAKDKDTKLFMPMVWDFDLSLGNCTYLGKDFNLTDYDGSNNGPKGWFVKIRGGYPGENYGQRDTYYQYMFKDQKFVNALKERWNTVKPRLDKIPAFIDKMCEYNKVAYDHNSSAGKNPRGNKGWCDPPDNFNNWQEAVTWLKDWYSTRMEWLDAEINKLEADK